MIKNALQSFWFALQSFLEDISQAFFFRKALFGFLLLALLAYFGPVYFAFGVSAALVGFGYTLTYSTPRILRDSGLVTLNGFFFGIAMASMFEASPTVVLCLAIGALSIPLVTKAMFELLQHWKLSTYVVPYILSAWTLALCVGGLNVGVRHDVWPEAISAVAPHHPGWSLIQIFLGSVAESVGRMLFLPKIGFGAALVALVVVFSPRKGLYMIAGALLGSLLARTVSGGSAWEYGFYSYSAGLVTLGLASRQEKVPPLTILLFGLMSCFMTIAADRVLRGFALPILSVPYVIAMWLAVLSRSPRVNVSWAPQRERAREREREGGRQALPASATAREGAVV